MVVLPFQQDRIAMLLMQYQLIVSIYVHHQDLVQQGHEHILNLPKPKLIQIYDQDPIKPQLRPTIRKKPMMGFRGGW